MSAPDPRERLVTLLEQELLTAGCSTSTHLARWILVRIDAVGLAVTDAPRRDDPVADWRTDPAADQPPATPDEEYLAARAARRRAAGIPDTDPTTPSEP